jgi:hypothetical protein
MLTCMRCKEWEKLNCDSQSREVTYGSQQVLSGNPFGQVGITESVTKPRSPQERNAGIHRLCEDKQGNLIRDTISPHVALPATIKKCARCGVYAPLNGYSKPFVYVKDEAGRKWIRDRVRKEWEAKRPAKNVTPPSPDSMP